MIRFPEIPLSLLVRLFGLVFVFCSIWTFAHTGLRWGWFSTPSSVVGLPVGIGLLCYKRWARWPAILLYGYWLVLAITLIVKGQGFGAAAQLVFPAVCSIPVLWKWSDEDDVWFERM